MRTPDLRTFAQHAAPNGNARVLLYSHRNFYTYMWEVPQTEFEDVIRDVDSADMIAPYSRATERARRITGSGGWSNAATDWLHAGREVGSRMLSGINQTLHIPKRWPIDPVRIEQDYDLFFATFHFPKQISVINRLEGLRERCKVMACFIVECWTPQIARNREYLRLLDRFDHVFLFNAASIPNIQRYTSAKLHFLPTAVDTLRFCPYPLDTDRVIDVYGMGRGSPQIHRQLLALAEENRLHYQHATVNHEVPDYRAHRVQVANLLRRTRYFFAHRINEDKQWLTGGEEAMATRYFEGAAAGTVMLGSPPQCDEWDELFPYEDAVIPVAWTERDITRVFRDLDAQPDRLACARQRSVAYALRNHDWVHRWQLVLDTVGLDAPRALNDRIESLRDLSQRVEAGDWLDSAREARWCPEIRGLGAAAPHVLHDVADAPPALKVVR